MGTLIEAIRLEDLTDEDLDGLMANHQEDSIVEDYFQLSFSEDPDDRNLGRYYCTRLINSDRLLFAAQLSEEDGNERETEDDHRSRETSTGAAGNSGSS